MGSMSDDRRLSAAGSLAGRMQRAVLGVLHEHEANGEMPTNGRFVFYELEHRGTVRKSERRKSRRGGVNDPREQEVIDALLRLRDRGIVPWSWIDDETRTLYEWEHAPSVAEYVKARVDEARINPWPGEPPLLLVESRSLGGPLRPVAMEYVCPLAATNGHARGFLHTEVAPILTGNDRPVLYLGDLDLQGDQIEANTRSVLEHEADRSIDWRRIAITAEQVAERPLTPVWKTDQRYRGGRPYQAVETEALGQGAVLDLVRDALDELLPEPLADVLERQLEQRVHVADLLANLADDEAGAS